ncbi:MAG: hypothetical protein KJO98_07150 [Rhodothermia bacterium]|nr:hypothetical protein [Rhodothermia bacterium]
MKVSRTTVNQRGPLHLAWPAFAAVALSLAIWWFRFGYEWAWGDQDEIVPYLLHLIDDSVLAADWFVQTQTESVGVRTPFVYLLRIVSFVLSPYAAVLAIFVLSWAAIGWSIYAIARLLSASRPAAALAVVIVLALTPKWTLGGNDVVYSMLVPEMAAWGLGLPGLLALMQRRFVLAGVLIGFAGWIQILVGLHLILALGLGLILTAYLSRDNSWNDLTQFIGVGVAVLSPMLLIIARQQLAFTALQDPDPIWILTEFRAPYHYMPTEFSPQSYIKFAMVVAAGVSGFVWMRKNGHWNDALSIGLGAIVAIAASLLLGLVFVELVPVHFVIKLQLFKLSVVAKVLLLATACTALGHAVFTRSRVRVSLSAQIAGGAIVIALLAVAAAKRVGQPTPRMTESVETWARSSTPANAKFLIPPSISSFRSMAERAIVVNYAATPFSPDDLVEWYHRITAIAPVGADRVGIELKTRLDASFHRQTESDWSRLAEQFSVDYLVMRQSDAAPLPFRVAFRDSVWVVYDLSLTAPPS